MGPQRGPEGHPALPTSSQAALLSELPCGAKLCGSANGTSCGGAGAHRRTWPLRGMACARQVGSDDDGYAVRMHLRHYLRYAADPAHGAGDDSPLYIFDGTFAERSGSRGLRRDYEVRDRTEFECGAAERVGTVVATAQECVQCFGPGTGGALELCMVSEQDRWPHTCASRVAGHPRAVHAETAASQRC